MKVAYWIFLCIPTKASCWNCADVPLFIGPVENKCKEWDMWLFPKMVFDKLPIANFFFCIFLAAPTWCSVGGVSYIVGQPLSEGQQSLSMPAGRKANFVCPILFATECELKSLASWTRRCEEKPCHLQQTPRKVHRAAKIRRLVKWSVGRALEKRREKLKDYVSEQPMRERLMILMCKNN